MKGAVRVPIGLKMTLLVLGGSALVFGLVLCYDYYYTRRQVVNDAEQMTRNLALSVARRIEQEFRAVEKVAQNLASAVVSVHPDEKELLELIKGAVETNKEVYGACVAFEPDEFKKGVEMFAPYYYKNRGKLIFEQLGVEAYDYFTKDWYHIPVVLQSPIWAEPYLDEGGGNITMTTYSYPILVKDEKTGRTKVKAVVTADVGLTWLARLVNSTKAGRTGYCFIISDFGTLVTHPRRELVMRESIFSIAEERHMPHMRTLGLEMLRNDDGFLHVSSTLTGQEAYVAFARIPSPGWRLAAFFPEAEVLEGVNELQKTTVFLACAGVAMLLLVSLGVARSMSRPLRTMASAALQVANGDLDVDLSAIKTRDEVGQLASAFTQMTEGLKDRERIKDTFGRYVTQEVVKRLLDSKDGLRLGGESREISLIMSDLRGFTALTTNMDPELVIKFLNRYLGRMVEIIIEHQGIIDEIIGDGILAFFGAPEPLEDHPAMAVTCALRMQEAMDEINKLNEADGLPHLEMGVAVNTGEVVVGNIGSERRTKYGAVGSQVNFTGRVESFTVGGQVLISESTYKRIADAADVKNTIQVKMKGMPGKVNLYDIRGIGGKYGVSLPESDETLLALNPPIPLVFQRLSHKTVTDLMSEGKLTEASLKSAVLAASDEIEQWEDLKLQLHPEKSSDSGSVIYAKALSVEESGGLFLAVVRFTSLSPEAYGELRKYMESNGS